MINTEIPSMESPKARQSMSQKLRGMFLCLPIIILLFFAAPPVLLAQDNNPKEPNESFIVSTWHTASSAVKKVVDWTVQTFNKVMAWVVEQSSQIARALTFWRDTNEPDAAEAPNAPQVLGEADVFPPQPDSFSGISTGTSNAVSTVSPSVAEAPSQAAENSPGIGRPSSSAKASEDKPTLAPRVKEGEVVETVPIVTPEAEPAAETAPAQPEAAEPVKKKSSPFVVILPYDNIAPVSQITAFMATSTATPGRSTSSPFTVSWSGTDINITGPAVIVSYDIQYQVDGGAWQNWLTETVLLSDLFTSQDEKTYGFRSRARDKNGNLEDYFNTADASIYSNLSIPVTPTVNSHTTGGTVMSNTADEDTSSGSTVQVTLSGTGEASNVLTITLAETSTTATTSVTLLGNWSKQFTLAEGANNFTLQTQESDGDNSLSANFVLNLEMVPTREVVINEIAWMGTAISGADEWLELYNASSSAINLTGWTIAAATTGPTITLSGTIAAKSYFLLEHTDTNTVYDIAADQIYAGGTSNQMSDSGELLTLRDSTSKLIDKVGSSTAPWFAGIESPDANRTTMERKDPAGDGTLSSNWATNDSTLINGKASDNATNIKGTPKSLNSQNTTIPRVVTDLQIQYIYTTPNSFRLYWTTPKTANLATTTPASYDLRYSTSLITDSNFSSASPITTLLTPSATIGTIATSTVSGLATSTPYYFAIKTNNGSNDSGLSNIYTATTEDGNYTQLAGYPGSTSTTFASSTSPYYITGNVAIPSNMTLTIQPGTVVKLAAGVSITFGSSSTLIMGTSSDTINATVITSRDDDTYNSKAKNSGGTVVSDGTPGAGDWGKILGGTGAVATINHGIISYGGVSTPMLSFGAGTITINNSIIKHSNNHGLIVGGAATSLTLASSTISNMLDVGLGITSSAIATVQGSTFTANRRGISVDTPAVEGSITILNNNFYSNNASTGDITKPNAGLHYADTDTLAAQSNWWGSELGPITTNPVTAPRDAAYTTTGTIDYSGYRASVFTILPSNL